jgi:dimethylargininase
VSIPNTAVGRALVRKPGARLAEGIVTHIERRPVDVGLAFRQWEIYVTAFVDAGWEIIEVPPADDCPDAVFVEDTVVMYRNLAVLTNPGADARKPEITAVETIVRELGCSVSRITPPATLDGGDVLKVGATVYVGRGGRTNAEGVRQLRGIFEPLGVNVIAVPLDRVLHLKSAVTALPDGTIIGYPPLVDDVAVFPQFRALPEEAGAHVVALGHDTVLVAASCPKSAELFADLGYTPVAVGISEFEKLEGCVTCLSVRLRQSPH